MGVTVSIKSGWVPHFGDDRFLLQDDTDPTKKVDFELSGITTNTTRSITVPDANFTLGGFPASSTDNAIPRFDGTTGELLQAGGNIYNTDAGDVGIGTASPDAMLHVQATSTSSSGFGASHVGLFERNAQCEVSILAGTTSYSILNFGDSLDIDSGRILYNNNSSGGHNMSFQAAGSIRLDIDSSGILDYKHGATADVWATDCTDFDQYFTIKLDGVTHYVPAASSLPTG